MSHIAEALAKARQRSGTPGAPALSGRLAGDPARLLARAKRRQRNWMILLSSAAALTAFLIWQRLTPSSPAPQVTPPAASAPQSPNSASPVAQNSPSAPAAPPAGADPAQTVRALAITAVLPGERPRLMYAGRIVAIGESVAPGLVFSGVRERNLLFTDTRGVVHERAY